MTAKSYPVIRRGLPVLIVFGLPVLALLIINLSWFDESLNDDIAQLAQSDMPVSVPPSDNAFVAMLGLSAAADRNPTEVGTNLVGWVRAQQREGVALNPERAEIDEILGGTNLDEHWIDQYPAVACHSRHQLNCLARLQEEIGKNPLNDARLLLMLDRYQAIRSSGNFVEPVNFSGGFPLLPEYGLMLQLGRINAVLHLNAGGPESALAEMIADRTFWQLVLRDSKSMLPKMVAVSGIWTQLQFVSEIIASEARSVENLALAEQVVQPLSRQEQDLTRAFASEQRNLGVNLQHAQARKNLVQRLFVAVSMQPNATLNRYYEQITRPMMSLATAQASQFRPRVEQGLAADFDYQVFPPGLYNLGGTMLLQPYRTARAWEYIGRIHDLQGMLSLVRLQIGIANTTGGDSMLPSDDVVQSLLGASSFRDPFTGKAMTWDKTNAALSFDCFGESLCEIRLKPPQGFSAG